ncbi:hypothetical protein [Shewanella chilikensis]|uniref:hypothetical protein n=1 Tax=Shewanella chilikensis TaxID=558541 RepID=UPI003A986529
MRVAYKDQEQFNEVIEFPAGHRSFGKKIDDKGSLQNAFWLRELIADETGKTIDPDTWRKNELDRMKLEAQSARMREMCRLGGLELEYDRDIIMLGAVTGMRQQMVQSKNVNFLPDVAKRNRRQFQMQLAAYLQKQEYARYLVVTSGDRIKRLSGNKLRKRIQKLNRKISRWASDVRKIYGVEVVCRTIELPRCKKTKSYHVHANIVVTPPFLGASGWQSFLNFTHTTFGTNLRDNGKIKNLNEVVKYVFKPEDLLATNVDSRELVWLYEQLFKLRLFAAYGDFAAFRKSLKDRELKIVMVKGSPRFMHKEKVYEVGSDDGRDREPTNAPAKNVLLAVTNPAFLTPGGKEPVLVIMNYDPSADYESRAGQRLIDIRMWQHKSTIAWEANGGMDVNTARAYAQGVRAGGNVEPFHKSQEKSSKYKVHTATITVPAGSDVGGTDCKIIEIGSHRLPKLYPDASGGSSGFETDYEDADKYQKMLEDMFAIDD